MTPQEELNALMEMEQQLTIVNTISDIAFTDEGDIEEQAATWGGLVLSAAFTAIDNETDEDSPWYTDDSMDEDTQAERLLKREYAAVCKALGIIGHQLDVSTEVARRLVEHFEARRLEMFPPDGTWEDIDTIIDSRLPASTSGSIKAIRNFTGKVKDVLGENHNVPAKKIAELLQARNGQPTILGQLGTTMNAEVTPDMTQEEKEEKVTKLIDEAKQAKSIQAFKDNHSDSESKSVPALPAKVIENADGTTSVVLIANDPRQKTMALNRLQGCMDLSTGNELAFAPVSAQDMYDLMLAVAETGNTDLTERVRSLLERVVLAQRINHDVYQVVKNAVHWCTVDYVDEVLEDHNAPTISAALDTLARYGLVQEMIEDRVKMYSRDLAEETANDGDDEIPF